MLLETKRLCLRPLTMDDLDALHAVLSDPVAMAHYPAPFTRARTEAWIRWNLDNYARHGFGLWAVTLRAGGACIGDCGITLQPIGGAMQPEIGYHIHRAHWGQGYATEAAQAVLRFAFEELACPMVSVYHFPKNNRSKHVIKKLGFVPEGVLRMATALPDGTVLDDVCYSMTREEFLAQQAKPVKG